MFQIFRRNAVSSKERNLKSALMWSILQVCVCVRRRRRGIWIALCRYVSNQLDSEFYGIFNRCEIFVRRSLSFYPWIKIGLAWRRKRKLRLRKNAMRTCMYMYYLCTDEPVHTPIRKMKTKKLNRAAQHSVYVCICRLLNEREFFWF